MKSSVERRKLYFSIFLIGILAFLFVGCSSSNNQQVNSQPANKRTSNNISMSVDAGQSETTVSVEVQDVERGILTSFVQFVGEARPYREVELVPELQERVEKINVEIGDQVKEGDILLELNSEDNQIAVKQAEASLAAAEASLQEALNGTRDEEIIQLKADLEAAESNLEIAQANYDRYKELYEQEYISEQSFGDYKNQLIAARSSYQSAQQSLKIAQAGSTAEEIKGLKAQVTQAEASLSSARLELFRTRLRAPISGIVSTLDIEIGEQTTSSTVLTISQLKKIKIKTYVSQGIVNKLSVGDQVKVYFSAVDTRFTGRIKNISPVADKSKKSFPVEIIVNNTEQLIKAGMYAEVKLSTDQVANQIVIPQSAVVEGDDGEYVYIINNQQAKQVKVETDISSEDRIVILSGINKGQQVVVKGAEYLKDGVKVKIVNQGDQ